MCVCVHVFVFIFFHAHEDRGVGPMTSHSGKPLLPLVLEYSRPSGVSTRILTGSWRGQCEAVALGCRRQKVQ